MEVNIKKADTWRPSCYGNMKQPEDQQVVFHHRYLANAERDEFYYWKPVKMSSVSTVKLKLQERVKSKEIDKDDLLNDVVAEVYNDRERVDDNQGAALRITTSIDNLTIVDESGEKVEIKTIDDFYKYDLHDMKVQYETYVSGISAVINSKN